MAAVGREWLEPATGERADTVARDAATACRPAFRTKRGMHPGTAVTTVIAMEATDISKQRTVGTGASAFWTTAPCIIAAGRDLEGATHQPDRPFAGVIADESEAHLGTSAKRPIAQHAIKRGTDLEVRCVHLLGFGPNLGKATIASALSAISSFRSHSRILIW